MGLLLAVIYLAFISLGLPDSLLGAAWPTMYGGFGVPVSYAGVISMIISAGTIVSSVNSDRLTRKLGVGNITAISAGVIALGLFGFSLSHSFLALCVWAIPYGLGAGSVDAALNNYVALHYKSRHMSWLHCMWGLGASLGPYVMGYALTGGHGWNTGYRVIAILEVVLTAVIAASLPLWKKRPGPTAESGGEELPAGRPLSVRQVLSLAGAKEIMAAFFCYCAFEATAGLWGASFLVLHGGASAESAARYAAMFFLGITVGRALSGFVTMLLSDTAMVRIGQGIMLFGVALFLFPAGLGLAPVGLALVGLGCAPIYPCIIHSTPNHFGAENSQALIGIQMAFAYVGTCLMPPLFGLVAEHISIALFPAYLFLLLVLMAVTHERMIVRTASRPEKVPRV